MVRKSAKSKGCPSALLLLFSLLLVVVTEVALVAVVIYFGMISVLSGH
jgi:hypothetical protein